jgi:hypothetical protein
MLLRAVGTWTPSRELLVQQFYSYAILTRTPFLLVRHSIGSSLSLGLLHSARGRPTC